MGGKDIAETIKEAVDPVKIFDNFKSDSIKDLLTEQQKIEESTELNATEKWWKKLWNNIMLKLLGHEYVTDDEQKKIEEEYEKAKKEEPKNENNTEVAEKMTPKTLFEYIKGTILKTESNGNHGIVNRFDVNGVSLGLLQWHKERARDLCRELYQTDPKLFNEKMGADFVKNMKDDVQKKKIGMLWITKRDTQKTKAFWELMKDKKMKEKMDERADKDIQWYITTAKSRWITETKTLIYTSSIMNVWQQRTKWIIDGVDKKNDVESVHKQALKTSFGKKIAWVLEKKRGRSQKGFEENALPMAA